MLNKIFILINLISYSCIGYCAESSAKVEPQEKEPVLVTFRKILPHVNNRSKLTGSLAVYFHALNNSCIKEADVAKLLANITDIDLIVKDPRDVDAYALDRVFERSKIPAEKASYGFDIDGNKIDLVKGDPQEFVTCYEWGDENPLFVKVESVAALLRRYESALRDRETDKEKEKDTFKISLLRKISKSRRPENPLPKNKDKPRIKVRSIFTRSPLSGLD